MSPLHCVVRLVAVVLIYSIESPLLAVQPDVTVPPGATGVMLSMPRPDYPYEARSRRMSGSGRFEIIFDTKTGVATKVKVLKSTGSFILDVAATDALWHWRVRPGKVARLQTPVTFTLSK